MEAETREARALFDSDADITIGGARDVRTAVERTERGYVLGTDEFSGRQKHANRGSHIASQLLRLEEGSPPFGRYCRAGSKNVPVLLQPSRIRLTIRVRCWIAPVRHWRNIRRDLSLAYNRLGQTAHIAQQQQRTIFAGADHYVASRAICQPCVRSTKGRIKGVVHDQSGSGATLWIEPLFTVELNNQYRSLQIQEAKGNRTDSGRAGRYLQQGEVIKRVVNCMAELDLIFALCPFCCCTGRR